MVLSRVTRCLTRTFLPARWTKEFLGLVQGGHTQAGGVSEVCAYFKEPFASANEIAQWGHLDGFQSGNSAVASLPITTRR